MVAVAGALEVQEPETVVSVSVNVVPVHNDPAPAMAPITGNALIWMVAVVNVEQEPLV